MRGWSTETIEAWSPSEAASMGLSRDMPNVRQAADCAHMGSPEQQWALVKWKVVRLVWTS